MQRDRDVERQRETWRETSKRLSKQGGRETRQARLPLELRPRLHAQQVLHLAHPPRYPLPWSHSLKRVGWAGTSAAGWLEVRQQKGLAKLGQSVGDGSTLAILQVWGCRLVRGPDCPSSFQPPAPPYFLPAPP